MCSSSAFQPSACGTPKAGTPEQTPDVDDFPLDGWVVQRRCPHQKADLTQFAVIDGNVLTCQMHGWQFDLDTGRCLTSADHEIRAERAH